jgi:hypothetical protein
MLYRKVIVFALSSLLWVWVSGYSYESSYEIDPTEGDREWLDEAKALERLEPDSCWDDLDKASESRSDADTSQDDREWSAEEEIPDRYEKDICWDGFDACEPSDPPPPLKTINTK